MRRGSVVSLYPGSSPGVRYDIAPTERAYRELKRRILTCRVSPGNRINERALSAEIGVRRGHLREACDRLVHEKLISVEKRGAFTVSGFSLTDIRELCELRRIVESKAAALAAERARAEHVARLLALAELNYRPGQRHTYEHYLKTNNAFHRQLARTSGNSQLEAIVVSVLDQINRPLYLGLDVGLDPGEATAEHLLLVDAVRRKRPALAARLMWDQITATEKRIVAAFGDSSIV